MTFTINMKKILFVCHGNICRSVMAEYMMRYVVEQTGRQDEFLIDSKAAHTDDIGSEMYSQARRKLEEKGIPYGHHRATLISKQDYDKYDILIGMDSENIIDMKRFWNQDPDGKIVKLMTFAGEARSVKDPWYTGDFEATYWDLEEGIRALLSCS